MKRDSAGSRRPGLLATSISGAMLVLSLPGTALAAVPSNDDFANRTSITSLPFAESLNTMEATDEAGEPHPSCVHAEKNVWYAYTPGVDAVLQADTFGSDFDTGLVIWTGDSLGSLTQVACNDDSGSGLESRVIFSASAGDTYLFQVGGSDGESGALSFQVGPPTSGSISGTVTSDSGEPLSDICVELRDAPAGDWAGWAQTSGSGTYTIGGLSDGAFYVRFHDNCDNQKSHQEEWFDNQPSEATATVVSVTSPDAVTGIDAELTSLALGTISGSVTSDAGEPLPNICLDFYDAARTEYFGWTETGSDGAYSFGVPEGNYNVYFYDGCDDRRNHEAEWFDDQPTWATATAVPVTTLQATTGIDAELTTFGAISGTVTSDTGEPLADTCVDIRDTATGYWAAWAETSSSGSYLTFVPEGTYRVRFSDCWGLRDHRTEWFDDESTEQTATVVVVTGSATTTEIDAELTTLAIGSISGTVTSEGGQPLSDICIDVYEATTGEWAGWAESGSSGAYSVELPEGAYNLNFSDWCDSRRDHQAEWFDNQPTEETAHEVIVTGNSTTAGIDAALAPRTPQTVITAGPQGATTSTTAIFRFAASEPGSSFQCSLDGSTFTACTSPTSYPDLAEGSHTFRVAATSPDGSVDPSPAERSWVVDVSAPVLAIQRPTGGTYVNNQSIAGAGPIVVAGYVIVEATAADPQSGISNLRFEVDGIPVAPSEVSQQGDRYSFTYRPASLGSHSITARGTNGAGLASATTITLLAVPAG